MKRSASLAVCALALVISTLLAYAQSQTKPTVWINPANQYANYLEAAVIKKHTPVSFTTNKDAAQLLATLSVETRKGSAARAIFLGAANSGAENNAALTVSDAKTGTVVFSYTCVKKGSEKSFQSTAECLAKHWGHFIRKGKP